MTIGVAALAGDWTGTNRLWVSPDEPVRYSETTATVSTVAHDRFATIRYAWAEGGEAQDGLLVLALGDRPTARHAWMDSWHTGAELMVLEACEAEDDGSVSGLGSYAAPSGPEWGWRVTVRPQGPDAFVLVMLNITPDGEEALAVEAVYRRT